MRELISGIILVAGYFCLIILLPFMLFSDWMEKND